MANQIEPCVNCNKQCDEHTLNTNRISVLEEKYSVVARNTIAVERLNSKVSILLTVMSFIVLLVSGGVMYTFTGLNNFKEVYAKDRLILNTQILQSQENNRKMIAESLQRFEQSLNARMDKLERKIEQMDKR